MGLSVRSSLPYVTGLAITVGVVGGWVRGVGAGPPEPDPPPDATERHERCANRIALTLTSAPATAEMLAPSTDLNAVIATLLTPPGKLVAPPGEDPIRTRGARVFPEKFARFFNASMNESPGESDIWDSAYHAAAYVLSIVEDANGVDLTDGPGITKPWSDVFLAPMKIVHLGSGYYAMHADATGNGVGYFRTTEWRTRYRGNDAEHLKIVSAARMLQNIVGLELIANTNAPGVVPDLEGRSSPQCAGCHKNSWYALDLIAPVFGPAGTAATEPFPANYTGLAESIVVPHLTTDPANPTVVTRPIKTDKDLAERLVDSEMFRFNTCRLAFKFAYGRKEVACEGSVFDKCMAAFSNSRTSTIQSAVAAIMTDAGYCE